MGALTVLALAVPVSALAGTYTWNLNTDFTFMAPGANPDSDQYGATPWIYQEGPTNGSTDPTTFSPLRTFSTNVAASPGLSTWSDASSGALVGINPTTAPITDASAKATVQPNQIFLEPGSGGQVSAAGWISPFNQPETVTLDGSVSVDSTCAVYSGTWSLDQTGVAQPVATGTAAGSFPTTSVTVAPGGSIYFTVSSATASCAATGLLLQITAVGTAPAVTLTSPAAGSSSTVATPTFSGAAGNDFGDSSQVTLNVYSGGAASGNPVQSVTVPSSGAAWSATLGSGLALGTYTAQAQQSDVVGDVGSSAAVTFSVTAPAVTLDSLGSAPQNTSTPTFSGTADTDPGSNASVQIEVFNGSTASGSPLVSFTGPVSVSGQYSVPASSPLGDGTYTAIAAQGSPAGNVGHSAPQSFSVDTQPPRVTLVKPGPRLDVFQLVFTGAAGTQPFDPNTVSVALYRGSAAKGTPYKTLSGTVKGSKWSATWPGTQLPHGVYTVRASQTDANGHTGMSGPSTFRIVGLPPVIGGPVTINRAGVVSLKLSCNELPGDTCAANVRVLTTGSFQTVAGGPVGVLSVLFASRSISGGQTATVTRKALPEVAAVLRHQARVRVAISATLHPNTGKVVRATSRTNLSRIGA